MLRRAVFGKCKQQLAKCFFGMELVMGRFGDIISFDDLFICFDGTRI
jgi:hypothetical protein